MKSTANLVVGVLEDDGYMLEALGELLSSRVKEVYLFKDVDEASDQLESGNLLQQIDVLIVDIMLPLPKVALLPAGTYPFEAGFVYHQVLESRSHRPVPVLFFTGVAGAMVQNEQMERRIGRYCDERRATCRYISKSSAHDIRSIETALSDLAAGLRSVES